LVRSCMTTAGPLLALSEHALLHCMSPLLTQSGHRSPNLIGFCELGLFFRCVLAPRG
jgi:hypothetical protein